MQALTHTVSSHSVSKSYTALCAASLQYLSSVSRCHSLSEAMFLTSLSLLRLICSKHIPHPFLYIRFIIYLFPALSRTDRQCNYIPQHGYLSSGFSEKFAGSGVSAAVLGGEAGERGRFLKEAWQELYYSFFMGGSLVGERSLRTSFS